MSSPADQAIEQPADEEWSWRLVKKKDSNTAMLELGEMYEDAPDAVVNALIHVIGESLIKTGTHLLQSSLVDDEDDFNDGY